MKLVTETIGGIPMTYREDTNDRQVIGWVIERNTYGAGEFLRGKGVIDIGAHIGSFSVLAASLGAARVYAYEPEKDNYSLLARNTVERDAVVIHREAVGPPRGEAMLYVHEQNLGCHSIQVGVNGFTAQSPHQVVNSLSFADVMTRSFRSIALLKLDCEGAEEIILPEVLQHYVDRIERISVEFHSRPFMERAVAALGARYDAEAASGWEWRFIRRP